MRVLTRLLLSVSIPLASITGFMFAPSLISLKVGPSTEGVSKIHSEEELVQLIVLEENTNQPLDNANVKLIMSKHSPVTKRTDSDGYATFNVNQEANAKIMKLVISKDGFQTKEKSWNDLIDKGKVRQYYLRRVSSSCTNLK